MKQLQAFLGLFNFYKRFILAGAKIVLPLTRALRGGPKGSTPLVWTDTTRDSFSAARRALSSSAVLVHPAKGAEISLVTDASATHIGAAIQQRRPGQAWLPLGFFSAQLDKAQVNYSTFDRELLAVVAAIRHFRNMLEGRSFVVFTDHKPLVGALHRRSDPVSAGQHRHLSFIAEFAPTIRHITSDSNIVADTLSRPATTFSGPGEAAQRQAEVKAPSGSSAPPATARPQIPGPPIGRAASPLCSPIAAIGGPGAAASRSTGVKAPSGSPVPAATARLSCPPPPVDLVALAAAQLACLDCQRAYTSSALRVSEISMQGLPILVDTSSGVFRPLVPAVFRRPIFEAIHGLAHPGIRASRRLIASRFVWPGLASQVAAWCRDCQQCQRAKATTTPASPPLHIANPSQRFSHLHINLVGPLPTSAGGHTHLLTVIDRSTRWAEAIPLNSTSAESCATALIGGWVARFGVPEQITSDCGRQFCSSLWDALCHRLGVKMLFTTPYHPQANGAVERFHRRLKESLRARLAGSDWPVHLPWVLLGLCAAPREDSGISAAELVYGSPLSLPGQILSAAEPLPSSFVRQLQSSIPCIADKSGCSGPPPPPPVALRTAKFVYVRSPPLSPSLSPLYRGPYPVRVPGSKHLIIDIGGTPRAVSVDNIKPHLGPSPLAAAPGPRRCRPPRRQ